MNLFSKRLVLHPENGQELAYWTKKWGVNVRQIDEAILESGSIQLKDIRSTLAKKGYVDKLNYMLHHWILKVKMLFAEHE